MVRDIIWLVGDVIYLVSDAMCLVSVIICLVGDVICLVRDVICLIGDVICLVGDVICLVGDVICLVNDVIIKLHFMLSRLSSHHDMQPNCDPMKDRQTEVYVLDNKSSRMLCLSVLWHRHRAELPFISHLLYCTLILIARIIVH